MFTAFLEMVVDAFAHEDSHDDEVVTIAIVNPDSYLKLNRP